MSSARVNETYLCGWHSIARSGWYATDFKPGSNNKPDNKSKPDSSS
ncbi:hypothetical protein yaldo0001_16160 [Yersinia aldovae ATCC 35236]|nr:hypothetical protein yaldo0001_16160 [Yersinia aldovae ATCC 35236]